MDQKKFINNGYEIFKVKKKDANLLRSIIIKYIKFKIKKKNFTDLNLLHKYYPVEKLNGLRVFLYNKINKDKKIQNIIHSSFKNIVDTVVGSENVQSYISLSIQYPGDETSLLPLHSDSSQSDSDFQANFWLPFVNVQKTKSMFIVNPKNSLKILKKIRNQKNITVKFLETKHKKEMKMMKLKFGEALVFSGNLLHGNMINKEKTTRLSINLRYKNLYSPYVEKVGNNKFIGNFYPVINKKLITTFNLKYPFDQFTK